MLPTDQPGGPRSHTFLLSLWREQADGPWRAALRTTDGGGTRTGFADVEQLAAYLLRMFDGHPPPAHADQIGPPAAID